MNLVALTALIAVCGAAKLDRTYLPPPSAKTAGGSPGSLQTPLQNSLNGNNGLGGIPKGSYTNEFDGVVVDAAAAGTRASGQEESGLGAPRIAYGSTNSKVGAAAFKTKDNSFQPIDGQVAGTQQSFQSAQAEANIGSRFQSGTAQGPERARAALDRAAQILRFESDVGSEKYNYAYETDNGISAEESGVATNGVQAQGGFSYTGDDGKVYTVQYTADEGGYKPVGEHLPTPPPIPEEILRSLEQNARDEAAGLVDDGSYDAQKYNAGSDYSESDNANGKYRHQSSKFGQADATASGTFVSPTNAFKPNQQSSGFTGQTRQTSGQIGQASGQFGQSSGRFGQGQGQSRQPQTEQANAGFGSLELTGQDSGDQSGISNNRFGSGSRGTGQSGFDQSQTFNKFGQGQTTSRFENANGLTGQTGQTRFSQNRFGSPFNTGSGLGNGNGNKNEYLPPRGSFNQKGRPLRLQTDTAPDSTNQFEQEVNTDTSGSGSVVSLSQQKLQEPNRLQGSSSTPFGQPSSSFGKPSSNGRPSNGFKQVSQSSQALSSFANKNEYLPPTSGFNQNQPISANIDTESNQQYSQPAGFQTSSAPSSVSQTAFTSQQSNGFQNPQANARPTSTNGNRFPLGQNQGPFGSISNQKDSFGFNSQKATSQPDTELTTPLEPNEDTSSSQSFSQTSNTDVASFPSRFSQNGRPSKIQSGNQYNAGLTSSPNQPSTSAFPSINSQFDSNSSIQKPGSLLFEQKQDSALPTQSSQGQYNLQFQVGQQIQPGLSQNNDVQFAPSTQTPTFAQQLQGADDSYYYNQPLKPFSIPQASKFPGAQSNQFNRVTQGSSFTQSSAQSSSFPSTSFSSQTSKGKVQSGASKYPQPPTLAPTAAAPSTQNQYQSSSFNGITQASISQFPSQSPTQSTQFNSQSQFSQTPNRFGQISQFDKPSFGQQSQSVQPAFGQQTNLPQRPGSRPSSFQTQTLTQFGQQSVNEKEPELDEISSQSVATQQYSGEIYEYNKPAQTLPPPEQTGSGAGQFGQKAQAQTDRQTQIEQDIEENLDSTNSQYTQASQSANQFGSQPSRSQTGSRPQFGQSSRPQFGQTASSQTTFETQTTQKPTEASRPQFGQPSRPFGQSQSQLEQEPQEPATQDSKPQFGFSSACCQSFGSSQPKRPSGQAQLTAQSSSFSGPQSAGLMTSNFAGRGEVFDASRKPPSSSFDSESGYHY